MNTNKILDKETIKSYIIKNTSELMNKYYKDNDYDSFDEEYSVGELDETCDEIICNLKDFTAPNNYKFDLGNIFYHHWSDFKDSFERINPEEYILEDIFYKGCKGDDYYRDYEDNDDDEDEDEKEYNEDYGDDEDEEKLYNSVRCDQDYIKVKIKIRPYVGCRLYKYSYYKLILEDLYDMEKYCYSLDSKEASESTYTVSIDDLTSYLLKEKVTLETIDDKLIKFILDAEDYSYEGELEECWIKQDLWLEKTEDGYKICLG